jgi:hypothetical protein
VAYSTYALWDIYMNKLQKYYILRRLRKEIQIIGTNSGQAFVEAAAKKHMERLSRRVGGDFEIIEVNKLKEYNGLHSEG